MGIPDYQNENELTNEYDENDIVYQLQTQLEPWMIKDLSSAHWADEMAHEKEVIIAEKEKIANDTIAALEAKIEIQKQWLERATKKDRSDLDFFLNHLKLYHMNIIEQEKASNAKLKSEGKKEKPLTKTIKLPYRDLTSKVQQPEIIRTNDEELIKWVEKNYSESFTVNDIKEFIEDLRQSQESEENDTEDNSKNRLTVTELYEFLREHDSPYVKRENKLAWQEWKKTLTWGEVPILFVDEEGNETTVGTKLVYYDENGEEVPFVELQPKEDKFDWKPVKE